MSIAQEIMAKVFPEGSGGTPTNFWVIPGPAGQPRWLIPESAEFGLPVISRWQPYSLRSQLQWQAVRGTYRLGVLQALPGVTGIQANLPELAYWRQLGWVGTESPVPTLYVGPPCNPNRKAILFLVDQRTRQGVCVAKIPLEDAADEKILHEANVLQALMETIPELVPALMCKNSDAGTSMQSFKPGQATVKTFTPAHAQFLLRLRSCQTPSESADPIEKLAARFEALPSSAIAEKALWEQSLLSLNRNGKLPIQWIHGDFVPWNIKRNPDGMLFAIDWEEASSEGLPLYDALFFHMVQSALDGRKPDVHQWLRNPAMREYTDALSLTNETTQQIIRFTLLSYWCSRLELGDTQLASRFARSIRPVLEAMA